MKYQHILPIIAILLLSACAGPQAGKYQASKIVAPVRESVTKVQAKVTSAQVHAKGVSDRLHQLITAMTDKTPELKDLAVGAQTEVDLLTKDLLDAQLELSQTQAKLTTAEGTVSTVISERDKLITENAILSRRYGKLKFGLCTLAAAGVGFLLFKFKWLLAFAGPYAWIGMVAAPLLTFGLCWKLIDWLL